MKTTVIHHSADYDGIFCREIAKKFLGTEGVTYIGWDFKDPPLQVPLQGQVIVMDLPLDVTFGGKPGEFNLGLMEAEQQGNLVWIDHHKSAIDSHSPQTTGYRIDGVAACRLAWQWFTHDIANKVMSDPAYLPQKQEYLNRTVKEPLAVRLAGEYDIWDHRGDGDLEFQFGLRSEKDLNWSWLLDSTSNFDSYTKQLVAQGKLIMEYSQGVDASVIKHNSFLLKWEGLTFLALNTARCNSLTFAAKDVPETGHDALLAFYTNGTKWTFSLYHASHRKDLDLSEIAKRYGGGGHRGACGFTAATLPIAL